ncbi:MAG: glycosyltransferase family 39 protein, partial [Planctomycetota bacterium]
MISRTQDALPCSGGPAITQIASRPWTRQDRHALMATLLLAVLLQCFLATRLACISRDGVQFVTYARQLGADPVPTMRTTTKQPGFSYLLLGAHRALGPILGGDTPLGWQRCGQLIGLIGGVCACGLVFFLARRLFDTTTASVAGILAAVWPAGAHLAADVLSDMPHLALYLLAFLFAYRALATGRVRHMALCGASAGIAYMLRQEALGMLAAPAICWCLPTCRRSWKPKLLGVVLLTLCFAAVVAPHSIVTGRLMPNKSLGELLFGLSLTTDVHPTPPLVLASAIHWWMAPAKMVEAWGKSGRYVISTLFLLAMFLKSAPRAEANGRRLAVAAVLLQMLAVQLRVKSYGEISSRYMVVPLALSIPWAAAGLLALLNIISLRLRARWPIRPIDIRTAGIVLASLPMLFYLTKPVGAGKAHYRHAGQWLYENAEPGDGVLAHSRLEQLMFYAGRTWPDETWRRLDEAATVDDIRRQIDGHAARWLVDVKASRHATIDESA